ncbi:MULTISPECIES: hypothetical protein [unclassified Ensifer]|uniref:hypothetical protein n=1 Tax=unclassified Ensifer TaxID=2633371 RepID=UPI000812EF6E|nr:MULTISPECIES: hypothetical protein [unclassified Ensifer]OCP23611.1 hypothetical protein BC363_24605 [Ensifer sp. LC384]OCP24298.1 hypothetical protein BC361_21085 [Ensifer sp. LC54]
MHLLVHRTDLPSIKESLRKAHPETKPTHRTEAAAKGFGFFTYASFLDSLNTGGLSVSVDDALYRSSLCVPPIVNSGKHDRALSRAVARAMLRNVLDQHPDLTLRGFDSIWHGNHNELRKSTAEREALFAERRREAYDGDWAADQFELALIFLARQDRIKSLNRQARSYSLKHRAENLSRAFGLFTHLGDYVANGMLIAAALTTGFTVKRAAFDSYDAYLNISMQTVNASRGWSRNSREEDRAIVLAMYGPRVLAHAA